MKTKNACPFCGFNSTTVLGPPESTQGKGYQVECINCGARGPCGMKDPYSAIGVWDHGDMNYRRPKIQDIS